MGQRGRHLFDHQRGVGLGDRADQDAVDPGRDQALGERTVIVGLGLELLAADHIQSGRLGRDLETLRGVATIYLPVVQDIGLRAPLLLLQRDLDGRLDGVIGHHPRERPHARGVVLLGLAGRGLLTPVG